jgi:hypothetical protein
MNSFYSPAFVVRESDMPLYSDGQAHSPLLNHRGDLLVAQSLPPRAELVSRGHSWFVKGAAAAPVVATPTTASLLLLWNGSSDRVYVIDSVFLVQVVVTAAIQNVGILANIAKQKVTTAPTNDLTPLPLYGNRKYAGEAIVDEGATLDAVNGVAAAWMPLGSTGPGQNTLQIGTIVDVDVQGLIILPPGGQLALTALAGTATAASVQLGVRWHELKLKTPA